MKYILLFLLLLPGLTRGQQDTLRHAKQLRITPLPVIYYSPETRLGFGALIAANFETVKVPDSVTKSSYAQTYFLYTMNKQYEWGNSIRVYAPQNRRIIDGKFKYTYFPEYYYGIATEDPESKMDTIEYNQLSLDLRFFWKVKRNFFVGFATRYNKISDISSTDGGHFINDMPLGYDGYWELGIAPAITIETRDNFVYPRKGFFMEVSYAVYPAWNKNSYGFRSFRLDARKYYPVTLFSDIDAIAFQFLAHVNNGNVPFKNMADLGGSNTMRGYYTGFYRYLNLYALQAEFRGHIGWRLGFALWAGAALTPEKWYSFFDHPIKPNAGLGLRIMINKKDMLNVRVDQGFGNKNQRGFYLDISEAY